MNFLHGKESGEWPLTVVYGNLRLCIDLVVNRCTVLHLEATNVQDLRPTPRDDHHPQRHHGFWEPVGGRSSIAVCAQPYRMTYHALQKRN